MLPPIPPNSRAPLRPLFDGFVGLHGVIDAVLEGALGNAYADDPANPHVARLELDFNAIAGDPEAPAAADALRALAPGEHLAIPESWTDLLVSVRGDDLQPYDRFVFSPGPWDRSTLAALRESLPTGFVLERITKATVEPFEALAESLIYNFADADDFLARSVGFGIFPIIPEPGPSVHPVGAQHDAPPPESQPRHCIASCSSYVISSGTLEFEIQTREDHQRRGFALVTGSRMIEHCLDNGLEPAWDAAHKGSARLAERLGFINRRTYTAYRLG
ncbi:MAG: GNAT family N-acetyltransferase [Chloroflexi bacterium]|nr:GNAT family N-acetyltransferase [Chloroflexota bacterium]